MQMRERLDISIFLLSWWIRKS